jgi:hypothetical protein
MFDLETKAWTSFADFLHPDKFLYRFRIDGDGMLHIVSYDGVGDRTRIPTQMSFASI